MFSEPSINSSAFLIELKVYDVIMGGQKVYQYDDDRSHTETFSIATTSKSVH